MSHISKASRREFLKASSALSFLGSAGAPFAMNLAAMSAASAQATNDYKALVCVFMFGGNDTANMVLPTDTTSWNTYNTVRNQAPTPINLPQVGANNGVVAISPLHAGLGGAANASRTFALHPQLAVRHASQSNTSIADLFAARRLAIIANAGPMIAPITKQQYSSNSVPRPTNLFSHNDQQSSWQAFAPEGARIGWGGRIGDRIRANNGNALLTCISTTGNAVFLSGQQTLQYQIGSGGNVQTVNGNNQTLFGSTAGAAALREIIRADNANLFAKDHAAVVRRSMDAAATLQTALTNSTAVPAPGTYLNPANNQQSTNGLAQQLQTVARLISARDSAGIGAKRQIFFVSIGGFDTHDDQLPNHARLMAQLDHAFAYFDNVLSNINGVDLRSNVTTFTASDFGRTFSSNGDGTDHGWGAHHFVMGGAVKGGDIYGRFPEIGLNTNDTVGTSSGNLIPQISVDQIGATLAKWFGIADTEMNSIFPNLQNFGTLRDLGFMA
jgi:uncharacterized protein (DUF1501 family)